MSTPTPDLVQLKANLKATWMAGDFGQIATYNEKAAEDFVTRTEIRPNIKLLDVACGTGNSAIPAARRGAVVTGIDIATNLLEQARQRATTEGLEIDFREGDAEELPLGDNEFDVVLSMFGAMFAPRPERVAAELLRVCRPGGTVAMANWTATGFVGEVFRVTSETTPPPPGMPAPILWGDESVVRQRFSQGTANVKTSRQLIPMHFLFPPQKVVALFREYFGPTKVAFSRLDDSGKTAFAQRLEAVWNKHNQAHDGTTKIDAEYLDVRVQKA